jgi:hypothetical protein
MVDYNADGYKLNQRYKNSGLTEYSARLLLFLVVFDDCWNGGIFWRW